MFDTTCDIEQWRDVRGWEGIYQISSHGRLRSSKSGDWRIMSVKHSRGWYLTARLSQGQRKETIRIHRLVAEAFIPNPEGKPEVNHKDLNKQHNHVSNLEWVTRIENHSHALEHSPSMINGMNHYNRFLRPKAIIQKTLKGKALGMFPNAVVASAFSGVCSRNITQVAARTEYKPGKVRRQAGGFMWEYTDRSGNG
jgi:hypothetical protein